MCVEQELYDLLRLHHGELDEHDLFLACEIAREIVREKEQSIISKVGEHELKR